MRVASSCIFFYSQLFKSAFDGNNTYPKSYARYLAIVVVIQCDNLRSGKSKVSLLNCTCS